MGMMRVLAIALVFTVIGGGIVYGATLYLGRNPVQVNVSVVEVMATPTPPSSPTHTPPPIDTPRPATTPRYTPPPSPTPQATLRLASTKPAPTPTPAGPTEREIVVEAFAECDGKYSGDEKRRRFAAANSAIDRDLHSVASIRALVEENCSEVFPAAEAQPDVTPAPLPTATKTPVPNYTPRPMPTISVPLIALYSMQNIRWIHRSHPALYNSIIDLPWVADGLLGSEKEAIDELLYIAVRDVRIANDLVKMPFMQTYETADMHALYGVNSLIRDGLASDLTNTSVYKTGVTDAWTPVLAGAAATESASAIDEYLDAASFTMETEIYSTNHSERVAVSVLRRKGTQAMAFTVDMVHQAVGSTETIMAMPLPTDHVIVVFDNRAVTGDFLGTNHGFAIGISQDAEANRSSWLQNVLNHEVAHYWWEGNADWIDEGMADTIAATASSAQGNEIQAKRNKRKNCTAENLSEIGIAPREYAGQFYCNYYLGEKLFRGLQDIMGDDAFTAAMQDLYRASRAKPAPRTQLEVRSDIDDVRRSFAAHSGIVEHHWKGDVNAPHRWDPDDSLNFTSHDAVVWSQKPTYSNGTVSFSGELTGEGSLSSMTLQAARQGGISNFSINDDTGKYLGSILPQLTDGRYWNLDSPGDVVADLYELSDGGFSIRFRWPPGIGSYADKHVTVWGYNNRARTAQLGNRADALGRSMVR